MLDIYDTSEGMTDKITGGYNSMMSQAGGIKVNSGTVNFYGGNISGNKVIYGTFNMYGGVIDYNMSGTGSAVYVGRPNNQNCPQPEFRMSGNARIQNNINKYSSSSDEYYLGAVYLAGGYRNVTVHSQGIGLILGEGSEYIYDNYVCSEVGTDADNHILHSLWYSAGEGYCMKLQQIHSAKPLQEGKKQTVYDYPATIICACPDRWELRRLRCILRRVAPNATVYCCREADKAAGIKSPARKSG